MKIFLFSLIFFICSCATNSTYNIADTFNLKDRAVECSKKDPICGVWEVRADGASWQIAIVPTTTDNEWNYHGIALSLSGIVNGPFSIGDLIVKIKKSDSNVFEGCQVWKNLLGMSFGCVSAEFGMKSRKEFVQVNHFSGLSVIGKTWNAILIEPATITHDPQDSKPNSDSEIIGTGTCFAVSPEGYLVTNHHVIKSAAQVHVRMSNGKNLPAKVVASEPSKDLAIIKIDAKNMAYLSFASSNKVGLGDEVFTIGYPLINVLGFDPKYTEGVVSAKSGLAGEALAFQITVPVQPGNSGGPLVNQQGQVIGIITSTGSSIAFFKESGSLPQNINWAVKSDYASILLNDIPMPIRAPAKGRQEAISNTEKAVCMVMVSR